MVNANESQDRRIARWLGVALFCLYMLSAPMREPYGDEYHYLSIARNLLTTGRPVSASLSYAPDGSAVVTPQYTHYAIGQSLVALPFVALASLWEWMAPASASPFLGRMTLYLLPALQCAAMAALVYLLARLSGRAAPSLSVSRGTAIAMALCAGAGTQLWPSAATFFADTSAACFMTAAVYCLFRMRAARGGRGCLVAAAWAMALAALCKGPFLLACPALALYGFWQARSPQVGFPRAAGFWTGVYCLAPFVLAAGLVAWYNHARFGSVWQTGYHAGGAGNLFGFSTPLYVGLYGIFLSAGRSVFLYSPLCLLAFGGARRFARALRPEAMMLAGACAPIIALYAKWWAWYGGWEWGNRFALFLIPLLMWVSLPAWRWLDRAALPRATRRLRMAGLALLLPASLLVQLPGVLIHPAAVWRLMVDEVALFPHPQYQPGVWELRDDMFVVHYTPQFSPVAVHAWLVWATLHRGRLTESELAARAPWVSLNPQWRPQQVEPYLGFTPWVLSLGPP